MATIALYANKMNQMLVLLNEVQTAVIDYKAELLTLQTKTLNINKSVCDLSDIASSIQSSTQIQEKKVDSLSTFGKNSEEFTTKVVNTDNDVAEVVNKRKDEFYEEYSYLKPECEKDWKDKVKDWFDSAADWCKDHWKEIGLTVLIIIGVIAAIGAIIATGGMALVPMLTALLTTIGLSVGTATTIATIASLTIAVIAVISTLGSATLNIIDTWGKIDNQTFNNWQTALNITSAVSNGLYSIGTLFNVFKAKFGGVATGGNSTNTQLSFEEALSKLEQSGLRPGQTVISRSRVMEIVEAYDPIKASSSVYTNSTGRYLVEGHHTTVATTMLGRGSGLNMNTPTIQVPSATNVHWIKSWYEFWKKAIKVVD